MLPPIKNGWYRGTMSAVLLTPNRKQIRSSLMVAVTESTEPHVALTGLALMIREGGESLPESDCLDLRVIDSRGITHAAVTLLPGDYYTQ